jgi:hypothetical protein
VVKLLNTLHDDRGKKNFKPLQFFSHFFTFEENGTGWQTLEITINGRLNNQYINLDYPNLRTTEV